MFIFLRCLSASVCTCLGCGSVCGVKFVVEQLIQILCFFFFSSRRRHTRLQGDWSSDVCSSDLGPKGLRPRRVGAALFFFKESVPEGQRPSAHQAAQPNERSPWYRTICSMHLKQIGRASCRERV